MKNINKNKLISIAFLCIIFSISCLNVLTNNTKDLVVASINKVRDANYSTLTEKMKALVTELESTYNSSIIWKSKIGKPTNVLDYKLFHKIDSKAALLGKKNWLFYKTDYDGNPIEDYKGTNLYAEEQINQITKNVKNAQEKFNSEDIGFYLLIPPNKEQIYSKYMPADIEVVTNDKKSDKLIRHLKDSNINMIDPKQELLDMSDKAQVYYRNDTHWNKLGAFIGAQHINQTILGEREEFDVSKIVDEGKAKKCDLLNILELSKYNDDIEFNYLSQKNNVKINYQLINDSIDHYTSEAETNKKILFIGDSFRWALEEWMPKYYSTVDFIHRNDFKPELIKELKPDIVIYEVVERHTDELLKTIY